MKLNYLGSSHYLRVTSFLILVMLYNLSACTSRVPRFKSVAVFVPAQLYDLFERKAGPDLVLNRLAGLHLSEGDRAYVKAAIYFFLNPFDFNTEKQRTSLELGRESLELACSNNHPLSLALKGYGIRNAKFGYKYDSINVETIWSQYIAACESKVEKSALIPWRIISAN